MPVLCDTNVLLALCYDRHSHHRSALAWLETQNEMSAILCRMTQLGLLRLLCHTTVMAEDVCTLPQAWAIYDQILADGRFTFCSEPSNLDLSLRRLTQPNTASPKLWQDAYLAAFAMDLGFRLVSFDRGFHQFEGLDLILLQ
jgi:uncharacterized protein